MALTHQDGATFVTQRLKPTKRLALQVANMLELGALEPDEDLEDSFRGRFRRADAAWCPALASGMDDACGSGSA
jgi:hypothetical protein